MTQLVISIKMTIEDSRNKVTLHSVKNSQGVDVTDKFLTYCKTNSLPLESQTEIEGAATEFSEANSSRLP